MADMLNDSESSTQRSTVCWNSENWSWGRCHLWLYQFIQHILLKWQGSSILYSVCRLVLVFRIKLKIISLLSRCGARKLRKPLSKKGYKNINISLNLSKDLILRSWRIWERKKKKSKELVEYRQQGYIAMQMVVRSQTPELQIDLSDLMEYPLTPVPFSTGIPDGCFAKTDKSKGLQYVQSLGQWWLWCKNVTR